MLQVTESNTFVDLASDPNPGERAWAALQEHGLPLLPQNYEVLFHHYSGSIPDLSALLNTYEQSGRTWSGALLQALWGEHFGTDAATRHADAVDGEAAALAGVANTICEQVDGSRTALQSYGQTLAHWAGCLEGHASLESLMQAATVLAAETASATARNRTLEQQLSAASARIAELRRTLTEARHEATLDPLTGIANRRVFDLRLRRAVKQARSEPASGFSLLLVDIDHFKRFNDDYGHQTGDLVLRFVAKILSDNVKGRDLVARYGGEEFAILLDGADRTAAAAVAEQIRDRLAQRRLIRRSSGEDCGQLTCSIGVAQHDPRDGGAVLVERTDKALYQAKRGGRNRVCLADRAL
jgi:diguanylate cyclase